VLLLIIIIIPALLKSVVIERFEADAQTTHQEVLKNIERLQGENKQIEKDMIPLTDQLKKLLSKLKKKQDAYTDLTTLNKAKVDQIVNQEDTAYNEKLNDCRTELGKIRSKVTDLTQQYGKFKGDAVETMNRANVCNNQLKDATDSLKDVMSQLNDANNGLSDAQNRLQDAQNELAQAKYRKEHRIF
jgi:chromosome segregation ATPase